MRAQPWCWPAETTTGNTINATEWFELAVEATPRNARQLRARFQQWLQTLGAATAISDHGRWRTPPPQPGYRGRGLTMMRALTTELHLHPSPDGTTVQLRALLHCSSTTFDTATPPLVG